MQLLIDQLVFLFGFILLCSCAFLISLVLVIRVYLSFDQYAEERFRHKWRDLIVKSFTSKRIPRFPPIAKRDTYRFLRFWNYYQWLLKGPEIETLNQIAVITGIDQRAKTFLNHWSIRNRLIAIETCGHLRDRSAWSRLAALTRSKNTILSAAAARTMVQIDSEAAIPYVVPMVMAHARRSPDLLVGILGQSNSEKILPSLVQTAIEAPIEISVRIARILEAIGLNLTVPFLLQMVNEKKDDELILICIRVIGKFGDSGYLDFVRSHADHKDWSVRVQVAATLGKLGTEDDLPKLKQLLCDKFWWVRYRAGQALAQASFCGIAKLLEIQKLMSDQFAFDMINHVIAEETPMKLQG